MQHVSLLRLAAVVVANFPNHTDILDGFELMGCGRVRGVIVGSLMRGSDGAPGCGEGVSSCSVI